MKIRQAQSILDLWKKLTNGSTNRKIFGAIVTIALATALVKVVAVAKELVVAWRFGTGDALDAFLIALLLPSFIINVVAGSFNAALIPTYIQVLEQEGKQAAQKLFSGVMVWSLALLGIMTILILATAPIYLRWIAAGFDSQKLDLTFDLLCAIAPSIMLGGIIIIWGAVLNAKERFALAAISPIMTPAITIVSILGMKSWGIFALAIGLVSGAAVEIVILGAALHRQGISLVPRWYGFDTHLRQVANQYFPIVAGAFLMCSAGLVDQSMAAMLLPGSVASLNYGNRVIALPLGLTTTALSTAVVPYFSKMIAQEDWSDVHRTLKRYLQLIFIVTVPLTILFIACSELIVQILFQRGSFTANDTRIVAQIQAFFAIQIPFYIASIFVVRLITSMRLSHILMWGSGLNLIINIVANYLFMQWFGLKGIALSTSCVYLFSFSYLLFFALKHLNKHYQPISGKQL